MRTKRVCLISLFISVKISLLINIIIPQNKKSDLFILFIS